MSGFEIAGMVLGALPVLIEAVTAYKNGLQTSKIFFRKKAIVTKLTSALILQRETLAQIVKSILQESGCADALDIEDDPYGCLRQVETQALIAEFLSPTNLRVINDTLEDCYDAVKRVARNIAGLVPSIEGATDDLRQIIYNNESGDRGWRDIVPRIKLMFSASEISKAIKDLDETVNSLRRLTSLIKSNRGPVQQSSSRKAVKLGKALRQARRFAGDLHQAIRQSWKSGCHSDHEAKLLLEDRIESMVDARPGAQQKELLLGFQMIFVAMSPENQQWHTATVRVPRDLLSQQPTLADEDLLRNQSSKVMLVLPTTPAHILPPPVHDICSELASAGRSQRQVALVLSRDQMMGTIASCEGALASCEHAEKITLKSLLEPDALVGPSGRPSIPLKARMTLALSLSSNLLQLVQTPWLQTPWLKEDIYFLRRSNITGHSYDFSRPYISLAFDGPGNGGRPTPPVEPKVALLELGILLLEIWTGETLEGFAADQPCRIEYYQRLAVATKWLDFMSRNPPPDLYDQAATNCIRGMIGGEARWSGWEDTKLWGAVCQDVIYPLHEFCKQWRSLPC